MGKLGHIIVEGSEQAKKILAPYLSLLRATPHIKLLEVEEVLLAMQQVPGIAVKSTFVASKTTTGFTDLVIAVKEKTVNLDVITTNYTHKSMGANTSQFVFCLNNILGRDTASVNAGTSIPFKYLTNFGVSYRKMLGHYNAQFSLGYG